MNKYSYLRKYLEIVFKNFHKEIALKTSMFATSLLESFLESSLEVGMNSSEDFHNSFLDIWVAVLDGSNDVFNKTFAASVVEGLGPEECRLTVVVVIIGVVAGGLSVEFEDMLLGIRSLHSSVEGIRVMVGSICLVVTVSHETISLSVVHCSSVRTVDRELDVVGSKTMEMSIGVTEDSSLEHLVWGEFDTRNDVGRSEGGLFDFGKVVDWVSVQNDLSHGDQRELAMRPDLGDIERIPFELICLFLSHDLNVEGPFRELALFDSVVQISDGVIRISCGQLESLLGREVLDLLVGLGMEFAPEMLSILVDKLEGVGSISVHVTVSIRSSSIAEQEHDLVDGFRSQGPEVPHRIGVLQMSRWMPLLSVDKVREEDWIADEEDRSVVSDQIPVSFFGIKLHGEASRISSSVSRPRFSSDSGESDEHGSSLSDFTEHGSLTVLRDVVSDFEVTVSSSTFGMDDSFGDSFTIEVSHFIEVDDILKEHRASGSDS